MPKSAKSEQTVFCGGPKIWAGVLEGGGPMLSDGRVCVCVGGRRGRGRRYILVICQSKILWIRELFFLQIDSNFFLHPAKFFRRQRRGDDITPQTVAISEILKLTVRPSAIPEIYFMNTQPFSTFRTKPIESDTSVWRPTRITCPLPTSNALDQPQTPSYEPYPYTKSSFAIRYLPVSKKVFLFLPLVSKIWKVNVFASSCTNLVQKKL